MAQRLARGAHNSEVTRSKRVAGILQFGSFTETVGHMLSDLKHSIYLPVWRRGSALLKHRRLPLLLLVRHDDGYRITPQRP